MTIVTIGIDLAKNIFAVHGVNAAGKPELIRSDVKRAKLPALINRIRGILSELGIFLPLACKTFYQGVYQTLEELPGCCNLVIAELISELDHAQKRVEQSECQIKQLAKDDT